MIPEIHGTPSMLFEKIIKRLGRFLKERKQVNMFDSIDTILHQTTMGKTDKGNPCAAAACVTSKAPKPSSQLANEI